METACPRCDTIFDVPEDFENQEGQCSKCRKTFVIKPTYVDHLPVSEDLPDINSMIQRPGESAKTDTETHQKEISPQIEQDESTEFFTEPNPKPPKPQPQYSEPIKEHNPMFISPDPKPIPREMEGTKSFIKEKNKKKKRKKCESKDSLPGSVFTLILQSIGGGGLVISYIIFLLAIAKDLSSSLNGIPGTGRRLLIWMGIASVVSIVSIAHLGLATIIKAINANTLALSPSQK